MEIGLRLITMALYPTDTKKKDPTSKIALKVPDELWNKFKATVPRTKLMTEAVCELIKEKVGEK